VDEEILEAPSLDALRGIRIPEPVSMAPQTAAWWVLFAVLALLVIVLALLAVRRWRKNQYRRDALTRLDGLGPDELAQLPELVKRVALDAWPREEVARLSGEPWLAFLDRSLGGGTAFTAGPGRVLPALAYDGDLSPTGAASDELVALVRTWIRKHKVRV